ncbi:MAG: hypothetical protein AAGF24_04275 [Cyanobacteria bacterium P01_H01_bin.121]
MTELQAAHAHSKSRQSLINRLQPNYLAWVAWLLALSICCHAELVSAETAIPQPSQEPFDLCIFQRQRRRIPSSCREFLARVQDCPQDFAELPPGSILTSEAICPEGLTPPSLWWSQMLLQARSPQLSKLVTQWLTFLPLASEPGRVDLVVNSQLWSALDYLERYEIVNNIGLAAKMFNYNTRLFNANGDLLSSYTCASLPEQIMAAEAANRTGSCQIRFHDTLLPFSPGNALDL